SGYTNWQYPEDHTLFFVGARLRRRGSRQTAFPANKVALRSLHDRHSAQSTLYHAYQQAEAPAAFWHGSVRPERSSDTNPGFQPNSPASPTPTKYKYIGPLSYNFEPPTVSGRPYDIVDGHYRWTRGGLKGVDIGATEVNTGQPR